MKRKLNAAFSEGDSALPVPVEPPVGIVNLPEEGEEAEETRFNAGDSFKKSAWSVKYSSENLSRLYRKIRL